MKNKNKNYYKNKGYRLINHVNKHGDIIYNDTIIIKLNKIVFWAYTGYWLC